MPKVTAKQVTQQLVAQREATEASSTTNLELKYENVWAEIARQAGLGKNVAKMIIDQAEYGELKYLLELNGYAVTNTSNEESPRYSVRISWPTGTTTLSGDLPLTAINPTDLNFYIDTAHSSRLYPTGGVEPYTFSVQKGVFPSGVNLASDDLYCTISGTPTVTGNGIVTVQVEDSLAQLGQYQVKWTCSK